MPKIKINSNGQIHELDSPELKPGQRILAEVDQIIESAVVICAKSCRGGENCAPTVEAQVKLLKIMDESDLNLQKELKQKAKTYLNEAIIKAERHGLDMQFIDAEFSFDEKKLTFFFSAEGRIDFRSLVADMVGSFHKIIRLQQIGPRDEAKLFGGFGKCGRELCCARFLTNLEGISSELSSIQEGTGAKLNKVTGNCGKLMCCLTYEIEKNQKIEAEIPKIQTPDQLAVSEKESVSNIPVMDSVDKKAAK